MSEFPNKILKDLNQAFTETPGGFVIVEQGLPKFVVIDYATYQSMQKPVRNEKKIRKILVTGGAGYIGSVTTRFLQKEGYDVTVFDNLSTGKREAVKNGKLVVGDIADRAALEKVFASDKFDAVMHFAGSLIVEESVKDPAKYYKNNVVNGLNLLDAMVNRGVKKIVFSSTAAVYGQPQKIPVTENTPCQPVNPYGETKLIFERMLEDYSQSYGIHSISLRYFNAAGAWPEEGLGYRVTGQETHLIPRVLNVAMGETEEVEIYGQDYATTDGTCVRDYIHVLDLAEAHMLALEKLAASNGAYAYNLGTGKGNSVLEVVDAAVEITGKMIPIKQGGRRSGDPEKLIADASKAGKDLGWTAQRGLGDIIDSSWQWQKSRM